MSPKRDPKHRACMVDNVIALLGDSNDFSLSAVNPSMQFSYVAWNREKYQILHALKGPYAQVLSCTRNPYTSKCQAGMPMRGYNTLNHYRSLNQDNKGL